MPDGQRYEYDAANRLAKVWRTNGTPGTGDDLLIRENKYDAMGRRVETSGPSYASAASNSPFLEEDRTRWVFAGLTPIQEYHVSWRSIVGQPPTMTLSREYIWGADFPEPVAMIDHTSDGDVAAGTPEVLHFLHDALGSVVALTNAAGEVVERYDYDPYGKTYITDNTLTTYRGESKYGNPFMWTGQAFDQNTRQYHFWARTYSSHLGRWLHRDPLGYVDGVNMYEYVRSDPIGFIDPSGQQFSPGKCARIRDSLLKAAENLYREVRQYDPDGDLGGKKTGPKKGNRITKKHGHRPNLKNRQKRLQRELDRYNQNCPRDPKLDDAVEKAVKAVPKKGWEPQKVQPTEPKPVPEPQPAVPEPLPEPQPAVPEPLPDPKPAEPKPMPETQPSPGTPPVIIIPPAPARGVGVSVLDFLYGLAEVPGAVVNTVFTAFCVDIRCPSCGEPNSISNPSCPSHGRT